MFINLRRSVAVVAAAAAIPVAVAAAPTSAGAATPRPAAASHPLLQNVSYAQFRSLLNKTGDSAFLVGDSAEQGFAARERTVEAVAKAAGLSRIYRLNSAGAAHSWPKLVAAARAYLKNGVAVQSSGPATSAEAGDSYFFVYYRPSLAASPKIVSWINLSDQASAASAQAEVNSAIATEQNFAPKDTLLAGHLSPRDGGAAGCTSAITNPAQHPYYVKVTIDGQDYQDGCDTLPGYDDYACTPIPDVQYDFADNLIFYYDDQGDLEDTAPWTEWSRISSYATWEAQQQAAASGSGSSGSGSSGSGSSGSSGSGSSGSGSSGSGSSGSGSSGSGSSGSGSSGSGGSGSSGSGSASTSTAILSRTKVSKVAGSVSKLPTSKTAGAYKVTITVPKGKSVATGKVTIRVYKVGGHSQVVSGTLSKGSVVFKVAKLSKGTWKVLISWPGNTHYAATSTTGTSIKVTK